MKKPVKFVASHLMVVSAAKWAGRRADYEFQLVAGSRCSPPTSWGIFTAEHTMVIFLTSPHEVDNVFFNERMTLNGKSKGVGVVVRGAVTCFRVILLITALQCMLSHIPFAGTGYLCQNFVRTALCIIFRQVKSFLEMVPEGQEMRGICPAAKNAVTTVWWFNEENPNVYDFRCMPRVLFCVASWDCAHL